MNVSIANSIPLAVLSVIAIFALVGTSTAAHPEVDGATTTEACDVCHLDVTPRLVTEWSVGRHGANGVKCFVCHGSTGADFVVAPTDPDRCVGCHADQVESFTATEKAPDCWTCHSPHLLSPHVAVPAADDGGQS